MDLYNYVFGIKHKKVDDSSIAVITGSFFATSWSSVAMLNCNVTIISTYVYISISDHNGAIDADAIFFCVRRF